MQPMSRHTYEPLQSGTPVGCGGNAAEDDEEESAPAAESAIPHLPPPAQPAEDAARSPIDAGHGMAQPGPDREPSPLYDTGTDEILDGFTRFLASGALESYPPLSPGSPGPYSFINGPEVALASFAPQATIDSENLGMLAEPESLSRFCSRLPSPRTEDLRPESNFPANHDSRASRPSIFDISTQDREIMLRELANFASLVSDLRLPSRLSLSRYIRGYVEGFQEHLPFLHIPSMTICSSSIELLLAMAAVGSQYCFESEKGVALFHAARAIANERIRRRDAHASMAGRSFESTSSASPAGTTPTSPPTANGPLGIPSSSGGSVPSDPYHPLIQTAQALLILMAMATWSKHGELLREALAIQSILASIVREDGLCTGPPPSHGPADWQAAMRLETVLRTKFVAFAFLICNPWYTIFRRSFSARSFR